MEKLVVEKKGFEVEFSWKTNSLEIVCGNARSLVRNPKVYVHYSGRKVIEMWNAWDVTKQICKKAGMKESRLYFTLTDEQYEKLKSMADKGKARREAEKRKKAAEAKIIGFLFERGCDIADTWQFLYNVPIEITKYRDDDELLEAVKKLDIDKIANEVGAEKLDPAGFRYYGWQFNEEQVQVLIEEAQPILIEMRNKRKAKIEKVKQRLLKKIDVLKFASYEELVRMFFIATVRVDEEGYFSTCGPECDDCFDWEYFTKDTPMEIRRKGRKFEVYNRKGYRYWYYGPTDEAIAEFAENFRELIDEFRNQRIQTIEQEIARYEKLLK